MTCAAPSVPQEHPATYPTFFELVLDQERFEGLAKAYGSELPWETVRTEQQQQEGSEPWPGGSTLES